MGNNPLRWYRHVQTSQSKVMTVISCTVSAFIWYIK